MTELVAFTAVAIVAGVLAAIIPARRASKHQRAERAAVRVGRAAAGRLQAPPGRCSTTTGLVVESVKVSVLM